MAVWLILNDGEWGMTFMFINEHMSRIYYDIYLELKVLTIILLKNFRHDIMIALLKMEITWAVVRSLSGCRTKYELFFLQKTCFELVPDKRLCRVNPTKRYIQLILLSLFYRVSHRRIRWLTWWPASTPWMILPRQHWSSIGCVEQVRVKNLLSLELSQTKFYYLNPKTAKVITTCLLSSQKNECLLLVSKIKTKLPNLSLCLLQDSRDLQALAARRSLVTLKTISAIWFR